MPPKKDQSGAEVTVAGVPEPARDEAADGRDEDGAQRDEAAARRDSVGVDRDRAAEQHDRAAEQRDRAAEQRDRAAEHSETASTSGRLGGAASDRTAASQDRQTGATRRTEADADRASSAADRGHAERDRQSSRAERALAKGVAEQLERMEHEANRLALLTTSLVHELRDAEGNRGGRIDNEKALDVANEAVERLNGTVARLKGLLGHGDAHKCEDRPADAICRILAAT